MNFLVNFVLVKVKLFKIKIKVRYEILLFICNLLNVVNRGYICIFF